MRKAAAVLAALGGIILTAACSSSTPPTDGCTKGTSQEVYQTGVYDCPGGTLVFIFATTETRDNWVSIATKLADTHVLSKGATWVKVAGPA